MSPLLTLPLVLLLPLLVWLALLPLLVWLVLLSLPLLLVLSSFELLLSLLLLELLLPLTLPVSFLLEGADGAGGLPSATPPVPAPTSSAGVMRVAGKTGPTPIMSSSELLSKSATLPPP